MGDLTQSFRLSGERHRQKKIKKSRAREGRTEGNKKNNQANRKRNRKYITSTREMPIGLAGETMEAKNNWTGGEIMIGF